MAMRVLCSVAFLATTAIAGKITIINEFPEDVEFKITARGLGRCEGILEGTTPGALPASADCQCWWGTTRQRFKVVRKTPGVSRGERFLCGDFTTINNCMGGPYTCRITPHGTCLCSDAKRANARAHDYYIATTPVLGALSKIGSKVGSVLAKILLHDLVLRNGLKHAIKAAISTAALKAALVQAVSPVALITFPLEMMLQITIECHERLERFYQGSRLKGIIGYLASELGAHPDVRELATDSQPILKCFVEVVAAYEADARRHAREMRSHFPTFGSPVDPYFTRDIQAIMLQEHIEKDARSTQFLKRFTGMLKPSTTIVAHMRVSFTHLRALTALIASELHQILPTTSWPHIQKGLANEMDKFFKHRRQPLYYGFGRFFGIRPNVCPLLDSRELLKAYALLPVFLQGDCGQTMFQGAPKLSSEVGLVDYVESVGFEDEEEPTSPRLIAGRWVKGVIQAQELAEALKRVEHEEGMEHMSFGHEAYPAVYHGLTGSVDGSPSLGTSRVGRSRILGGDILASDFRLEVTEEFTEVGDMPCLMLPEEEEKEEEERSYAPRNIFTEP